MLAGASTRAVPQMGGGRRAVACARARTTTPQPPSRQLNRLSDAELRRRGLSRSTLAREIVDAVERRGCPDPLRRVGALALSFIEPRRLNHEDAKPTSAESEPLCRSR